MTAQVDLGAVDVKVEVPVLDEKPYINMLDLSFPAKLDWGSYLFSNALTVYKIIGASIHSVTCPSSGVEVYL